MHVEEKHGAYWARLYWQCKTTPSKKAGNCYRFTWCYKILRLKQTFGLCGTLKDMTRLKTSTGKICCATIATMPVRSSKKLITPVSLAYFMHSSLPVWHLCCIRSMYSLQSFVKVAGTLSICIVFIIDVQRQSAIAPHPLFVPDKFQRSRMTQQQKSQFPAISLCRYLTFWEIDDDCQSYSGMKTAWGLKFSVSTVGFHHPHFTDNVFLQSKRETKPLPFEFMSKKGYLEQVVEFEMSE